MSGVVNTPDVVNNEIVFDEDDLTPIEVPVRIGKTRYALYEALAGDAKRFEIARANSFVVDENGKFKGLKPEGADLEAFFLSMTLYYADPESGKLRLDKEGRPEVGYRVPKASILKMRSSVVSKLYEEAKRISGIDTENEEVLRKEYEIAKKRLETFLEKKEEKEKLVRSTSTPASASPNGDGEGEGEEGREARREESREGRRGASTDPEGNGPGATTGTSG